MLFDLQSVRNSSGQFAGARGSSEVKKLAKSKRLVEDEKLAKAQQDGRMVKLSNDGKIR